MNKEIKYMEKYKGVIHDLKTEIENRYKSIEKCEAILMDANIPLEPAVADNLKSIVEKNKEVILAIEKILKKYEE